MWVNRAQRLLRNLYRGPGIIPQQFGTYLLYLLPKCRLLHGRAETSEPELEARDDFNTPKNLSFITGDEGWAHLGKIKGNLLAAKCQCVLGEKLLTAKYIGTSPLGLQEPPRVRRLGCREQRPVRSAKAHVWILEFREGRVRKRQHFCWNRRIRWRLE